MFAIDWGSASTNLGADLAVAALGMVFPYWIAGKLVLFVALAGPCAAAAWLNRILFTRWSWWSLSFLLLAWTTTSLYGFINYQLSLAAALLFACFDALSAWSAGPKFVARVILAAAVLLIHPFGFVFYGLLLAALTIGPSWTGLAGKPRLLEVGRNLVWPIAATIVPVVILLLVSSHLPGGHSHDPQKFVRGRLSPYGVFVTATSPFLTYRMGIDLLFFAPVLALYVYSVVVAKIRTHAGVLVIGLIVWALSLVMVWKIGDASVLDRRLPLMAALLVFAGALPEPFASRTGARASAAGMLGLALARTLWIGSIWFARQADVEAVEAALQSVPPGASLFVVQNEPDNVASAPVGRYLAAEPWYRSQSTLMHVPVMAIPWRKAFVSTIFAIEGQQPLRVVPPWTALKSETLQVPDVHTLDASPKTLEVGSGLVTDWDQKFDYVVAVGMDHPDFLGPFNPPPQLKLVSDQGYARLYRIQR